jgi:hypothetical protein
LWLSGAEKVLKPVNQSFSTLLLIENQVGFNYIRGFDALVPLLTRRLNRFHTTKGRYAALPDLWLKLYWMIHFAFLAFAEGLAVPRY